MDSGKVNFGKSVVQDVAIYFLAFIRLMYTERHYLTQLVHLEAAAIRESSRKTRGKWGGGVFPSLPPESMLGWGKFPCATDNV
jgi:hypothetical protein